MPFASNKARFRDMGPDELQHHADELYAQCNGDLLKLSRDEHEELKHCAANYYDITGEALNPSGTTALSHF